MSCREVNAALTALKRSDKKLQSRLQGLSERAAHHGAAAAASRLALEQAVVAHREAQTQAVATRREQDALASLGAAKLLLEQVLPKGSFEALERAVETLESVALRACYVEGEAEGRSVPSVAALALAAGRGKLRPHEGAACGGEVSPCIRRMRHLAELRRTLLHGRLHPLHPLAPHLRTVPVPRPHAVRSNTRPV